MYINKAYILLLHLNQPMVLFPYENNSKMVIPKAHISEACENLRYFKHSGAHLRKNDAIGFKNERQA